MYLQLKLSKLVYVTSASAADNFNSTFWYDNDENIYNYVLYILYNKFTDKNVSISNSLRFTVRWNTVLIEIKIFVIVFFVSQLSILLQMLTDFKTKTFIIKKILFFINLTVFLCITR